MKSVMRTMLGWAKSRIERMTLYSCQIERMRAPVVPDPLR